MPRRRFDVIMSLYLRHMFAGDVTSRKEQRVSKFHGFIHTILNKQRKAISTSLPRPKYVDLRTYIYFTFFSLRHIKAARI